MSAAHVTRSPAPEIVDAPPPYATIAFDCDSTLSSIEGIDELATGREHEIRDLTEKAMRGEVALEAIYGYRLAVLRPTREAVGAVGALYVERLMPHARELVLALRDIGKRVCVVSGGLAPAVRELAGAIGVEPGDVYAVAIEHDAHGRYAGYDSGSPLARSGGKAEVARELARAGPVAFVGDGMTDLEAAAVPDGAARFVAYGGVVRRDEVFDRARVRCEKPDLAALLPLLCHWAEFERLDRDPRHADLLAACRAILR